MRRLGATFLQRVGNRTLEDLPEQQASAQTKNSPKTLGALFVRLKALETLKGLLATVAGQGDPIKTRSLILQRADIGSRNRYQFTALHIAAANGHEGCVHHLFERKADIAAKDVLHRNALHHAAKKGRTGTVLSLINLRADVNATDKDGCTPLDLAKGSHECATLLKHAGACGWTRLMIAVESGEAESVSYFNVREAVLCLQMRYPFPTWLQSELGRFSRSDILSAEDLMTGLDNARWSEAADEALRVITDKGERDLFEICKSFFWKYVYLYVDMNCRAVYRVYGRI